MKKKIDELSRELLEKILEKYRNRPDWDKRSLSQMVDGELKKYNQDVKNLIEAKMYDILGSFYFENTNAEIAVTPVLLSDMLYKNAKEVSKITTKILNDAIKARKTIGDLAKELYEGYGFREKEPLDLIDKYILPKYIKDELKKPGNLKEVMKQIEKLKTKPLRIAYKNIFRQLEKQSEDGLANALYVATQEKARYYANRIAKTEIHRASMSKWAKEMFEDDEVEFVKFRLSTAHKIRDICDFYANLDIGYGKGIVPKKEMRTLPLHPHCYDAQTEVYTNKGWKFFKDLKGDELFLSFNPENRVIEFVKVKNFVCWLNNGKMISFSHKHFDLLVTDKHKMAVYKRVMQKGKRVEKFEFVEADRCNNKEFKIPRTAIWVGKDKKVITIGKFQFDTFAFCEFMGYWLSDGSVTKRKNHYQISIAQQDNQERIYKVIERLGFNPFYAKGYVGFSSDFGEYLMQFGKAKDKFIPNEIRELDKKYLWKFLEAFVSCDGNIRPEKEFKGYKSKPEYVFYTSSKKMADDLGELILKCGYQPSFYIQNVKGKKVKFKNGEYMINEDIWIIRLKRSQNANVSNLEIKEVEHNDYVYCVELEKFNVLWVRRNGKTCFSGNCSCVYDPYYREVKGKRKSWKQAVSDTMSQFSEYEQKQILGSKDMLTRFKSGEDIEKIFNTIRPKYPIRKYLDVFSKMSKNFKEDYLKHNKIEYFDEEFEELKISEICKKIGVDKKDLDEIVKKTKFEVEGAVYYKNNGERVFIRGEKNYIDVPYIKYIEKFIHSHPKGTSFSAEDIEMCLESKITHIVAFNDKYLYSLKLERFDFDFDKKFIDSFEKYDKILTDKITRGEITQSQKDFSINHKVWKDLFSGIKGAKYDYFRIRK